MLKNLRTMMRAESSEKYTSSGAWSRRARRCQWQVHLKKSCELTELLKITKQNAMMSTNRKRSGRQGTDEVHSS
jgi:hypothetical protein